MSEYQYYEFIAIDRPLTTEQISKVRAFSTRAEITPTSFVNEYHWGDFKGDPKKFIENYFDAMVYFANWGTRQFMFRLPTHLVDEKAIEQFASPDAVSISRTRDFIICDLAFNDENHDFDEPDSQGLLSSLIGIRAELLRRDYRGVYIAWLSDLSQGQIDDDEPEPPLPPGLKQLTGAQVALADFLGVNRDLLQSAANDSAPVAPVQRLDVGQALATLPSDLKDRWLAEIAESDDPHAGMRLRLLMEQSAGGINYKIAAATPSGTTAGDRRRSYEALAQQREEAERLEREARQRREAAAAEKARQQRLATIRERLPQTWESVERAIEQRNDQKYKEAVSLLKDLRDATTPGLDPIGFRRRLDTLIGKHARKGNLMSEMKRQSLL